MNEQLKQWLSGNPIHGEQCCPDFSCCRGIEYMAPVDIRKRYCKAIDDNDEKTQFEMLGMFLGAAFSGSYIAGLNTDGHNQ